MNEHTDTLGQLQCWVRLMKPPLHWDWNILTGGISSDSVFLFNTFSQARETKRLPKMLEEEAEHIQLGMPI